MRALWLLLFAEDAAFARMPLGEIDLEGDHRTRLHRRNQCLLVVGQCQVLDGGVAFWELVEQFETPGVAQLDFALFAGEHGVVAVVAQDHGVHAIRRVLVVHLRTVNCIVHQSTLPKATKNEPVVAEHQVTKCF